MNFKRRLARKLAIITPLAVMLSLVIALVTAPAGALDQTPANPAKGSEVTDMVTDAGGSLYVSEGCAKNAWRTWSPAEQLPSEMEPENLDSGFHLSSSSPLYGGILKVLTPAIQASPGYPPSSVYITYDPSVLPALETLFRLDEQGNPIPHLATNWEYAPDLSSMNITLREGVKFHDGTDFNAPAVNYNLDKWLAMNLPSLSSIESIDVIGPYTVRLNLTEYNSWLLWHLAMRPGLMISPTAVETHGIEWARDNPVGTGPFKLKSYEENVSLEFVKNENYWQAGKPYLDGVDWIVASDPEAAKTAFLAEEADAIFLQDLHHAVELQSMGFPVMQTPRTILQLSGDSDNPASPFHDIKVRQAVDYAIDKEIIANALTYGLGETTNQPAVPGSKFYSGEVTGYPYNPDKGKQLLAEAGYPAGFSTRIITLDMPLWVGTTNLTKLYLAAVGINADIEVVTTPAYYNYSMNGWQNGLILDYFGVIDGCSPLIYFYNFVSSERQYMVSRYLPEDLDTLIFQAIEEPDESTRLNMIHELMKETIDEYDIVSPLYVFPVCLAKSARIHDTKLYEPYITQWTPEDAWLYIHGSICGDVNCDGKINMADVMILWYDIADYPYAGAWEVNCCE